jgi:hypothetical protein
MSFLEHQVVDVALVGHDVIRYKVSSFVPFPCPPVHWVQKTTLIFEVAAERGPQVAPDAFQGRPVEIVVDADSDVCDFSQGFVIEYKLKLDGCQVSPPQLIPRQRLWNLDI